MNYTITDGQYYKVTEGDTLITYGKLEEGQVFSTIKTVTFITEEEYNRLEAEESEE